VSIQTTFETVKSLRKKMLKVHDALHCIWLGLSAQLYLSVYIYILQLVLLKSRIYPYYYTAETPQKRQTLVDIPRYF